MLIIISSEKEVKEEAKKINKLFKNDLLQLNLRKKTLSKDELISLLKQIDKIYYSRIVLHQHIDLVFEYDLKGFHFNRDFPFSKEYGEKLKENSKKIGISAHQICDLAEFEPIADYQFISPLYDSISKQDYKAAVDYTALQNYLNKMPKCKIIGLGGITDKNTFQSLKLGLFGIASLGYIWENEANYLKNYFKLNQEYNYYFDYLNF